MSALDSTPSAESLRRRHPSCPRCDYDLSDGAANVCPECGYDVLAHAKEEWAQNRLPDHQRNQVGFVLVAGLVPNVLFLPIAFMLASGRSDACMSLPLASAATLILLLVWSGRLAELGRGPVVAFRRAIPLFIAAAWAWPVLLLLGPFVFPVWRLLTSP